MITLPKGWNNAQLEAIFEKHITALADELTQVLLKPVLDQLRQPAMHVTFEALESAAQRARTKPLNETAALYDGSTRQWRCPHCNNFSDLRRRAVTTHMRSCEGADVMSQASAPPASTKTKRRKTRKAKS